MGQAVLQVVPVASLSESKANPRRTFDTVKLNELAESIKAQGVIEPLVVREHGKSFEIVSGSRRYRAARMAGLTEVPAIVREMTDTEALEAQVIVNLQREDVHPIEEAEGYQRLMQKPPSGAGYTAAQIAEKVGKSVKYVYDRMKLTALTPKARDLFYSGTITAGHAILLARLTTKDQQRIIDPDGHVLFEDEKLLWDPHDTSGREALKAISVRELQAWIDQHVRFDRKNVDPMLFPETAAQLEATKDGTEKVVLITHDHFVQPDARDPKERVFGPRSWKRADGREKSKVCECSVTGVIVVGPGRGEAFKVCTAKERCKQHWAGERKAARKAASGRTGADSRDREMEESRKRQAHDNALRAQWKKAVPSIVSALAERVRKRPTKATGLLAQLLLGEIRRGRACGPAGKLVPLGSSADDLIRHASFLVLWFEAQGWQAHRSFPKVLKAFGLDARKLLEEAAPLEPTKVATSAEPKG